MPTLTPARRVESVAAEYQRTARGVSDRFETLLMLLAGVVSIVGMGSSTQAMSALVRNWGLFAELVRQLVL